MKYSVFSLILPDLTFEDQVNLLNGLGYDAIEIRIADIAPEHMEQPYSNWGNHKDPIGPDNLSANVARLKRVSESAAMPICGLAPYTSLLDPEAFKPVAAAAQELGAGLVRVRAPRFDRKIGFQQLFDGSIAGLEHIEKCAKSLGVKAVIETQFGTIAPSASAVRRILEGFDPTAVGAIFNPGNLVHEGYEQWGLGLQILGPYLAHVHVKNAMWVLKSKPDGEPFVWESREASLREGIGNWADILRALQAADYDGYLTVEDSTDQPARDKLGDILAFLKNLGT